MSDEAPLAFLAKVKNDDYFIFARNKNEETYLCINITDNRIGNHMLSKKAAKEYFEESSFTVDFCEVFKGVKASD